MRGLCCSILLLVATPLPCSAETTVHLDGREILYHGELSKEANERVFDLYSQQRTKPTTLTITSPGGPIDLGLELGEWIHKHNLNIKVYDLCFSSCANYVFPAGRKKLLDEDAIVGFHGGPTSQTFDTTSIEAALKDVPEHEQEKLREEIEASFDSYVQVNTERESEFYRKLGISPKLNTLGQSEQYQELHQAYDGWVYTPGDMRVLGLSNVEVVDDSRPSELTKKPKVFLLELAPESTLMTPVGRPVTKLRNNRGEQ